MNAAPKTPTVSDSFWRLPTLEVAREILGKVLVSEAGGRLTSGRIVETEAYLRDDPACHAFRGSTARNGPMFESAGLVYVYFTYGSHWCLNFTTGERGVGEAVLIRAMEPLEGLETMAERRGRSARKDLLSGPGKICQAMGVNGSFNYHDLRYPPLMLLDDGWKPGEIIERPRIGISTAVDRRWRFYPLRSVEWVSRK